ncbi:MAG TPA: small ribosomal subunit Rsm22 family protein [Pseudolabrys sp.]|jgi:ribosomal protein RSM22 (predicted rRNA methylase)
MDLPPLLRRAIDDALSGTALSDLAATAAALSQRYREERHDAKSQISDRDALAYLAVRLPATYAAVRTSFGAVAEARPDLVPKTALDVGAGPGTALWAAAECWPTLADALLLEASPIFRTYGERLAAEADLPNVTWRIADVAVDAIDCGLHDLVTLAYVLNELAPEVRPSVLLRLWQLTVDTLVIVEPGTPAGWQRILAARGQLIEAGGHVIAPCPHAHGCPLQPPDWCHFAQRVARSRVHRQTKGAEVPWEDEKFSYVAVARKPASTVGARVIARPRKAGGHITLKLCRPDGSANDQVFSRRDGALFKRARPTDWGSSF